MDFNHYFSNDEINSIMLGWSQDYPELVHISEIGQSHEKRSIWLITLSNNQTGEDTQKPAIWLDGNIHATELAGTTTILCFIDHMLQNHKKDPQVTRQLDELTFYIVPRINPDGAAAAMDENPRYLRSGVRPYPWSEIDEGLHVQDIDGDSRILQMRIPDPSGDWKPSSQNPRFLVKREPAERDGTFYRLLPEGIIDNYDGYVIKIARPKASLDFNRNFPFEWRPENEQQGAGPYPASESEINAVVRFIAEHRNISLALTFHTFSRALLRPFSTKPDDQMDASDLDVFKKIGTIGTQITAYPNVSTFHDFTYNPKEVTTGAFDDWLYDHMGAFVFTVELWDLPSEAGIKDRKLIEWYIKHPVEDDLSILKWVDENVGPDGYVEWRSFNHPQLGQVEIGGWDTMFTWRNPPHKFMEKEARTQIPFIKTIADLLPQISIHTLKATHLGDQTWAIDLVVENSGYLPTYTSQQAKKRLVARPVLATIQLPEDSRILLGKDRIELGHMEGRTNKEDVSSVFGYSPTDNRGHIQWVIDSPPGSLIRFTVHSDRGGTISREIELGEMPN